jgi:hypothetical protein
MEELRLKVFENRVLRKIFGRHIDEEQNNGETAKEKLHDFYFLPNIIRAIQKRRTSQMKDKTRWG